MSVDEKGVLADQIRQTISTLNSQLTVAHYAGLAVVIQGARDCEIMVAGNGQSPHVEVTIKEAEIRHY
ncbi:hypothetical protein [Spirosoma agri]|uniref:Uncharacterized protein n=1 Tax=Spirosoma agri TaxID=1987381 RepID=A0A6M0IJ27_9BACT|nr:hypothetical protein [Spirosoma agri]NEU68269.1 hypothetical protein [Spirosoma agri]